MNKPLLIKNARLVNEGEIRDSDLLIRSGRIARIDFPSQLIQINTGLPTT